MRHSPDTPYEPAAVSVKPVDGASAEWDAERLRARIIKGELLPGARLVERRLSVDLDVSRTPVREALKILCADGLVEISLHRGARVATYTPEEAIALFDLIAVVEALAAERLAERIDAATMADLEERHTRMIALYDACDGRCCRTLPAQDSRWVLRRIDGPDDEARACPLPCHELVRPQRRPAPTRVAAGLGGPGDGVARIA